MGFKWKCPECKFENHYSGTKEQDANSQCTNCKKKLRIYKHKIENVDNQQNQHKSTLTINKKTADSEVLEGNSENYQQNTLTNQHESTKINKKSTEIVDLSTNNSLDYRLLLVAVNQYLSAYRKNYDNAIHSVHPETSQMIPIYEGIRKQKKLLEKRI